MGYRVSVLSQGFSGKTSNGYLGLSTLSLIQGEGHAILVDAGPIGIRESMAGILHQHGLSFSDVDYVLLTHSHYDHAYNVDLFPNAVVVLSQAEWDWATSDHHDLFVDKGAIAYLENHKKQLIQHDHESIVTGIQALFTPGHTPGSTSYLLTQGNQRILFCGDACKNRGELKTQTIQLSNDKAASLKSLRLIHDSADILYPGHDAPLAIHPNGTIVPLADATLELDFGQGVTVNGRKTKIILTMD